MSRPLSRVALLAALLCLLPAGTAVAAPCHSSTPAAQAFADPVWDVEGYNGTAFAPDIVELRVALDGACGLTLDYLAANAPATSDFYAFYVDADGNPATGLSSGFRGADFAIARLGPTDTTPALFRTTDAGNTYLRDVAAVGTHGAALPLADLGPEPGVAFGLYGATSWTSPSTGDVFHDFAPQPGAPAFGFPFAFATQAPAAPPVTAPPVAPPAATPQAPRPVTGSGTTKAKACKVPRLKGLTLAGARTRLRRAGCRTGRVVRVVSSSYYVGKVIRSTPAAATTLADGAKVDLRVGKRKPRRKARRSSVARPTAAQLLTRLAADAGRR